MPLIDLTLQHGQSLEEARWRLEAAVSQVNATFGSMIQRVEWAADRSRVKLNGLGFWIEMSVDALIFHATGDVPILGQLLSGQNDLWSKADYRTNISEKAAAVSERWANHRSLS